MFISMLKKEFKQFLRCKSDILLLFVFPVVLITTLSLGLDNMMNGTTDIFGSGEDYSKVYYTMEDNNQYKDGFMSFKDGVEETVNIKFEDVDSLDKVKEEVDNYEGLVHININKDGFSLYSSRKGEKLNAKVFRSIFESMLNEYAVYNTISEYNPNAFANFVNDKYDEYVVKEGLGSARAVSASEYYTFAELALIIFFISITIGESVYKETQLRTINRIRLSKVRESTVIGAKVSLGICIGIFQTLLIYVYSSIVLNVDWGRNTLKFIMLFILFSIFASVLGAVVGLIGKKDTSVASSLNAILFIICALGGSYTPLNMIVTVPILNKIMYISPIYWINTATSSMICGLESNAYIISIFIPIVLSIVLLILYFSIMKRRGDIIND